MILLAAFGGLAAILAIAAAAEPRPNGWLAGEATAAKAATPELSLSIQTGLATQYKTTVLLENSQPVALTFQYDVPRQWAGHERRILWSCNRGRLEHQQSEGSNRFHPPGRSAVSTIEAELSFYPRQSLGKGAGDPSWKGTARLDVISPSPATLLNDGVIDGFRIGQYLDPKDPAVQKKFELGNSYAMVYPEKFRPPEVFYLVDDRSRDLAISPHVRLGDFALDYPWFSLGKRQYIALDWGLVRKVEDLIALLQENGLPGEKLRLVYGFRPPAYNIDRVARDGDESLKAPFSLHQYGQAVDVIVDADGDLRLDDLDRDGKITVRDATALVHYVNVLDRRYRSEKVPLYGGAGIYDHHDFWERPVQTPYVHLDVRGFLGEKDILIRWPSNWPDTGKAIPWSEL